MTGPTKKPTNLPLPEPPTSLTWAQIRGLAVGVGVALFFWNDGIWIALAVAISIAAVCLAVRVNLGLALGLAISVGYILWETSSIWSVGPILLALAVGSYAVNVLGMKRSDLSPPVFPWFSKSNGQYPENSPQSSRNGEHKEAKNKDTKGKEEKKDGKDAKGKEEKRPSDQPSVARRLFRGIVQGYRAAGPAPRRPPPSTKKPMRSGKR